jgi:hypothetical protein
MKELDKEELLSCIAKLQIAPFQHCREKEEARALFWIIAEMAWDVLITADMMVASREEFERKQEKMFEYGWGLKHGTHDDRTRDQILEHWVEEDWPEVID